MFATKCLALVLFVLATYWSFTECKCGVGELMKYGKAMQKMAQDKCKSGAPSDAEVATAKKCAQAEAGKAHADYKKYVQEGMQCMTDKVWADPCNEANQAEVKKCAEKMMKDHPNLKSEAMKWVNPHCQDFVNHMKDFSSCCGTPLKA